MSTPDYYEESTEVNSVVETAEPDAEFGDSEVDDSDED